MGSAERTAGRPDPAKTTTARERERRGGGFPRSAEGVRVTFEGGPRPWPLPASSSCETMRGGKEMASGRAFGRSKKGGGGTDVRVRELGRARRGRQPPRMAPALDGPPPPGLGDRLELGRVARRGDVAASLGREVVGGRRRRRPCCCCGCGGGGGGGGSAGRTRRGRRRRRGASAGGAGDRARAAGGGGGVWPERPSEAGQQRARGGRHAGGGAGGGRGRGKDRRARGGRRRAERRAVGAGGGGGREE